MKVRRKAELNGAGRRKKESEVVIYQISVAMQA
jgi:hypothetical protein